MFGIENLIWRLADDIRRNLPVMISNKDKSYLVTPLDGLTADGLRFFDSLALDSRVLITARRSETLKIGSKGWDVISLKRPIWLDHKALEALADPVKDLEQPLKGPFERLDLAPSAVEDSAIRLHKMALMLPACLIAELESDKKPAGILEADANDILALKEDISVSLVSKGKVPIAGSPEAKLAMFRLTAGGPDYMAFILPDAAGKISDKPLVRLHSECFTGDLLGSLKCDCGPQLRGAIKAISEGGGGCLLYLPQEGRGIGLAAKMRAYALQDLGYDTVDANIRLGYDVDERDFRPASEMLKKLGFNRIRLMTNNPNKVAGMQETGIDVLERVHHQFESNDFNRAYLETKKTRTGHLLT